MRQAYEVSFNRIYVLESLRPEDRTTGSDLFADVLRWKDYAGGAQAVYQSIENKSELEVYLRIILADTLRGVVLPLIHLELHGAREGLVLSSGELITWQELVGHFREVNLACKNNLLVSLAACAGAFIYETISPQEQAPFWGFVGAWNEVVSSDVENFTTFFDTLLTTGNLNEAIIVLNRTVPVERQFRFYNAEAVFERVRRAYTRDLSVPDRRNIRVQSIMAHALSNLFIRYNFTIPELRSKIESMLLEENEETWVRMKRGFLSQDESAENR